MGLNLDPQSLDALADLICGDNQPWYRKGWQLPSLFRNAGLKCPDHDGSTRKWWTLERLREYAVQQDSLVRVVLRVGNPREYLSVPGAHTEALAQLNQILELDGFRVVVEGANPKIETAVPRAPSVVMVPAAGPTPDFTHLTSDQPLAFILAGRWREAELAFSARAYLATVVMLGSLMEGLLLAVVNQYPREANLARSAPKHKETGKAINFGEWSLSTLIEVAFENRWIQSDAKRFSHSLREFRNLVHPWLHRSTEEVPDEDTAVICWQVVKATLNDLARLREGSPTRQFP